MLLGTAVLLPAALAHSATVVSFVGAYETGAGPFTPSYGTSVSTNLLSGLMPVATTGNPVKEAGMLGLSVLTNGSIGPIGDKSPFVSVGNYQGGGAVTFLTYQLPTATAISSIGVYGGWVDAGRDEQDFTFRYSTDGGTTFTDLIRVQNKGTVGMVIPNPVAVRTVITDDAGPIANGALITHVQFNFGENNTYPNGVEAGWTGLSEVAVYAVPETSAAMLGAIGALGLLRRRRNA